MKDPREVEDLPYQSIDMGATGIKLKETAERAGFSVRKIQYCLQLAYPQPIYRWYRGEILPSVNHLYMLSVLLGVHMEDLLVTQTESGCAKKCYPKTEREKTEKCKDKEESH